ncbi:MAG: hypothetical protein HKL95_01385 [Phycisphaerae bacterium]|nr:hypothetical protein [Phycisphaerae bacterium]
MRRTRQIKQKLERLAIARLTLWLIGGQLVMFGLHYSDPRIVEGLLLIPAKVLDGQWWRLLTFICIPMSLDPLWMLLDVYVFWLIGTALENAWGAPRYNLFLLIGYVATAAVAFLIPDGVAANGFLYGSTFLAFAFLYPDFLFYLFLVLPVRVKYLAWVAWGVYLLRFLNGSWMTRLMILAAVLNFLLFFRKDISQRIRHGHRRMARKAAAVPAEPIMHRCSVCGITERSHPQMEFRYCTKCTGALCYCLNHINSHQHR